MPGDMPWRSMRFASRLAEGRKFDLTVEGGEQVPSSGPVIIAARHFHHLYDGSALVMAIPRPVHIVAALDWIKNPRGRAMMERACGAARWPVVDRLGDTSALTAQSTRTLRHSVKEISRLLQEGRVVVIFPEGFPNIDPGYTPKPDDQSYLPFKEGMVRFAAMNAADGRPVPVVPAGFSYRKTGSKWSIRLRFGTPLWIDRTADRAAASREIETAVRELSGDPDTAAATPSTIDSQAD